MGIPQKMPLAQVAKQLELLEETLIYRFLDRIQFAYHPALYQANEATATLPDIDQVLQHSLLGLRLEAHEAMEQHFGRYSVAEEFPFSQRSHFDAQICANSPETLKPKELEEIKTEPLTASLSILQKLGGHASSGEELRQTAQMLKADLPLSLQDIRQISQCDAITLAYLEFLSGNCGHMDDMQYGSALEHDVMVLQCISRRIHFGALYVAEIKFCEQESLLRPLILSWQKANRQTAERQAAERQQTTERQAKFQHNDSSSASVRNKILELITRQEVEQRILQRVYDKTSMIQQFLPHDRTSLFGQVTKQKHTIMQRRYLEPENMRRFYAECIIPLTKEGELAYLYRRV